MIFLIEKVCNSIVVYMQSYLSVKMFSVDALKQRLLQHNDLIVDDTSVGAYYTRCWENMPSLF